MSGTDIAEWFAARVREIADSVLAPDGFPDVARDPPAAYAGLDGVVATTHHPRRGCKITWYRNGTRVVEYEPDADMMYVPPRKWLCACGGIITQHMWDTPTPERPLDHVRTGVWHKEFEARRGRAFGVEDAIMINPNLVYDHFPEMPPQVPDKTKVRLP